MTTSQFLLRASASLMGTVVLALPSQAQCPDDDWLEDNDSCATAIPAVFSAQSGLVCTDTNLDFYAVTLPDTGTIDVDIFFTDDDGDLDLYLTEAANAGCGGTAGGDYITRGFSSSDNESVSYTNTTGSAQDLIIWIDFFGAGCNEYDMTISLPLMPTCPGPDAFEPNDSCGTARAVVEGVYFQLNQTVAPGGMPQPGDIYSVLVPQGHSLTVDTSILGASDPGDLPILVLLSADCMTTHAFDFGGSSQTASWVNPNPAATEVKIQFAYNVGVTPCIEYAMAITFELVECPDADSFEPNDTCPTAAPIDPGFYSGLTVDELGVERDWFTIDVPMGKSLDVAVLFIHADGNIDAVLDDGCGGGFLDTGFSADDNEFLSYENTTGMSQSISLGIESLSGVCANYALEIVLGDLPAGCANTSDDGFEDNDDCASSAPLGEGLMTGLVLTSLDEDFFNIDVPDCYALRVTAFFSHAQADIDLRLWGTPMCGMAGLPLVTSTTLTDNEELTWANNTGASANYVLEVDSSFVTACGDYELLIELIPGGPGVNDDAFEDNDDCASAASLPLGFTPDLFIASADEDFYAITLQDGETLEASILFATADGDLDLYFTEASNPGCGGTAGADWLVRGFSGSDDEMITWTNNTGGAVDYILWIDWWDGQSGGCSTYDMFMKIFEDGRIGSRICVGVPNSTGVGAHMYGVGSVVVDDNSLGLVCEDLPLMSSGYFLNSQDTNFLPNPGGSNGNLCIASLSQGRHLPPILNSGVTGQVALSLDLDALPQPSGPVAVAVGETWYWQYWYRDTDGMGNAKSNFSDAICVTFE